MGNKEFIGAGGRICLSKDEGGMGFRNMAKFNVALLAKQGWGILNNPDSLVARVLKAKYFPNENFLNSCLGNNCSYTWKIAELIDDSSRKWKEELIGSTFPEDIAEKILRIPLAKERHENMLARSGEPSGEFTVRSAYKPLQNTRTDLRAYALQNVYKKFYKKLWLLNLPSKIKITT
ncbi:reverse transcriptase [Gossypium australe]|uniref:Reverse transcriptase n=1 Tax=Gossypium australe TaxID=47621 RepID=A0A5B6V8G2_9ROSI|nr:reverse transcriptase [Gossypium australe]